MKRCAIALTALTVATIAVAPAAYAAPDFDELRQANLEKSAKFDELRQGNRDKGAIKVDERRRKN